MQIDQQNIIDFRAELKRQNLRITQAREEVFEVLHLATHPLTVTQITQLVPSSHFVSVYRTIDVLTKTGIVKQVPAGLKHRFELGDLFRKHHHHATCEQCGSTVEVHSKQIETIMTALTKEAGLIPTKHYFEMFGICSSCSIPA